MIALLASDDAGAYIFRGHAASHWALWLNSITVIKPASLPF